MNKNLIKLSNVGLTQYLMDNCTLGRLANVKEILTNKDITIDINVNDGEALRSACINNRKDVVYYLLFSKDLKVNIDYKNYKEKLFIYSAEYNYVEVIKLLVEESDPDKRVNLSYMSDIGINKAVESQAIDVVNYFVPLYKDTEKVKDHYFCECLFRTAYKNYIQSKSTSVPLAILSALINDLNILETETITKTIKDNPEIQFLFAKKDLNLKLKEILPNKIAKNKSKI